MDMDMDMNMEKMQNQSVHFVLSTDAKPRLKWTPELHQIFIEAVHQLGGAEKATPKSLMRVMGIQGLTLYHLKSHLQKYRLGKSQHLETCSDNQQEDCRKIKGSNGHCSKENSFGEQKQITENKIAQAFHMQMEVQRKLCEQIEVQKHLQLRIEAQGKYLHSVLKKAQDALQGYNSSTVGLELTKSELSQLVTVINNACPSSSISELTETRGLSFRSDDERKQDKGTMCSLESSLTSSESCGRNEEKHQPMEEEETTRKLKFFNETKVEFPFEAFHQTGKAHSGDDSSKEEIGRKRNKKTDSEGSYCVEQPSGKRCGNKLRKLEFDLNNQYHSDTDSR
ncbi:hypothetical protein PIB30_041208 [Stylosanthes scabra]|uniref:HTH myb-type domain-containing protein n=1 Tax=Stylosanthes scabra TaxID=79078 RepID=A0ABU6ZDJ7_9FABA|nr:hypothetical protein [Stylosanthes scabra]